MMDLNWFIYSLFVYLLFFCLLILFSGQQVGPLLWEVPMVVDAPAKKGNLLIGKDKKVLVDLTNSFNDHNASEIDTRCLSAGCSTWSDSRLLREVLPKA